MEENLDERNISACIGVLMLLLTLGIGWFIVSSINSAPNRAAMNATYSLSSGLTGNAAGVTNNLYSSFDLASATPMVLITGFIILMMMGLTAYWEWRCKWVHVRRIVNGVALSFGIGLGLVIVAAVAVLFLRLCLATGTVAVKTDPMVWAYLFTGIGILYVIGYAGEKLGWSIGEPESTKTVSEAPAKRGRGRPRKVKLHKVEL